MLNIKLNKLKKKMKLVKIAGTILLTSSLLNSLNEIDNEIQQVPFTATDLANNEVFAEELKAIYNEDTLFTDTELKRIISDLSKPLDKITTLTIDTEIEISSFEDLKYLPNLENLTIKNQDINITDLKYNQSLKEVKFVSCNICNFSYLSNSISKLEVVSSKILDDEFTTPYYLKEIYLVSTFFNNLNLKNPELIRKVVINSESMIDLSFLEKSFNLEVLSILRSSNVTNVEVLTSLPKFNLLYVDDYASIWLTKELYEQLPVHNSSEVDYLKKELNDLDKLASQIVPNPEINDKEKLKNILLYILEKYTYDEDVKNSTEKAKNRSLELNEMPISNTLYGGDNIICINYACLLTALCNRVGLSNYQYFSIDHTWNQVIIDDIPIILDLTALDGDVSIRNYVDDKIIYSTKENESAISYFQEDNEEALVYYDMDYFFLEEYYEVSNELLPKIEYVTDNIGYIHNYGEMINKEKLSILLSNLSNISFHFTALIFYLLKLTKYEEKRKEEIIEKTLTKK